jgi:hypothetical protein
VDGRSPAARTSPETSRSHERAYREREQQDPTLRSETNSYECAIAVITRPCGSGDHRTLLRNREYSGLSGLGGLEKTRDDRRSWVESCP